MIRKNPNLPKNKTKKKIKKYIETNHNKKQKTSIEKPNKQFISLNKQKINPIEQNQKKKKNEKSPRNHNKKRHRNNKKPHNRNNKTK